MLFAGALMLLAAQPDVRIGNYLVTAPAGIAMIWGPKEAVVLDLGADFICGEASPEGSYYHQTLKVRAKPVTLDWGRVGDSVIARLTSSAQIQINVNVLPKTWPGVSVELTPRPSGFSLRSGTHVTDLLALSPSCSLSGSALQIPVSPDQPGYFTLGPIKVSPKTIDQDLSAARTKYERNRPSATGDWGDFLGAIADNLNNSRIYASDDNHVEHTVSRGWAGGDPNNAPLFCWDSFFNGSLACLNDPKTARDTVRAILSWQTPEGLVPNFGHWNIDNNRASNDRSQPPVGSLCIWKMHQRWPDLNFLKEVYPKLLRWHRWWPKYRDGDHDGLLEWGSTNAGKQGALWETGWDDTPEYADSEMVGQTLDTDAVDLNSLWAMDAENLAYIADAVGDHSTAKDLRAERLHTNQLMNDRLWNPDLGIYCSRKWASRGGAFLTRLTPMNFYPLICGAPSQAQAESVLKVLTDPKLFWGRWILPTVSFIDPVWKQQTYWHGTVWAPVNFLVFQGLRRYANSNIISEFASKSIRLFMENWNLHSWCGENFGSDNGIVNGDKHYTWGALMCLIGLESICTVELDGRVTLNGAQTSTQRISHVPLFGRLYDLETGPGWAKLSQNHHTILEAKGKPVTSRI